jgi:hypothetical protein
MKKNLLLFLTFMSFFTIQAQEVRVEDALRYAVENITGTARYRAMGGAFGALGADLSALNQNPAGSLFFNNNYATATGSINYSKNSSLYFGTRARESDTSLDLNQAGAVFIFVDNHAKTDWKKIAVAFNYENTNNFNNTIFSAGTNPYNSIGNYFVNFAQGYIENDLSYSDYSNFGFDGQQAYLGYQSFLIDPVTSSTYSSHVPAGANYYQDNSITSTGYNGKITGNFAAQYKNYLFLGVNINAHFTDYVRTTSLFEQNDSPSTNKITSIRFDNELHTFGSGISLNLGAIIKPIPQLRLGIAYESPTWYHLTDELTQRVSSKRITGTQLNTAAVDPQMTNVYDPYKIQTPSKWTGSFAYVFGKKGLISIDVSTKDYNSTRFKPKNLYSDLNTIMSKNLTNATEVRIGGEYRIKLISLRAGYHFDQSPYKIDQAYGDLTGYSGGIGYNLGDSKIDIAYSYDHRNFNQYLISSGMPDPARISRYNSNIVVSYSVNF